MTEVADIEELETIPAVAEHHDAEPFEVGIRDDIPHGRYLSIEALSASGIKLLLRSPLHYRYDKDSHRETTESMVIGTATHKALLEPADYAPVIKPTFNLRTNIGKADHAAWMEANAGAEIILTAAQSAKVDAMVGAARRHPIYDELIATGGRPEVSFQWEDHRHGSQAPCKARFDWLRDDRIAIDVKTCRDASPDGFARACAQLQYHYQAAWYNNGHEHLKDCSLDLWAFLAIENEPPYGVAAYVLQPNALHFAADQCERAMLLYAQIRKTGYWRGYPETIQPLVLPRWAVTIPTPEY